MKSLILSQAKVTLKDGSNAYGPVTTEDGTEFLFKNTHSDLDLYFFLKKDEQGEWFFSGGPGIEIPSEFILQVGEQIDNK